MFVIFRDVYTSTNRKIIEVAKLKIVRLYLPRHFILYIFFIEISKIFYTIAMGGVEYKENYQLQMNKWIDGRKTYTLLYKSTRDGCWHSMLSAITGEQLLLFYTTYTVLFLQAIRPLAGEVLERVIQIHTPSYFALTKTECCQLMVTIILPFTTMILIVLLSVVKNDLKTFTGTVNSNGTYHQLNGSTNFGHSYTMNGETYIQHILKVDNETNGSWGQMHKIIAFFTVPLNL